MNLNTRLMIRQFYPLCKRNYIVKNDEWYSYGNNIAKTYKPNIGHHNVNEAIMDTLYNQTNEIKNIKTELMSLNTKLNNLIDNNCSNKCKKH